MLKKFALPAIVLGAALVMMAPNASARDRDNYYRHRRHHTYVRVYTAPVPAYGYYDRHGRWHYYHRAYYDRWGYYHPY